MAAELIHEAAGKMTHLCRKMVRVNIRWRIVERVSIFRDFFRFIWERFLACSAGRPAAARYRRLHRRASDASGGGGVEFVGLTALEGPMAEEMTTCYGERRETDQYSEDLVSLKISLLGDCQIGKTSFVIKYVGDEQEKKCLQMKGLSLMDKTLSVQGAKILCSIWDVGGDQTSLDHLPIACKDAVAILFMFDLTSRCTLNSVIGWYSEARKWNQTAIPILVGTKFDDFVRLPPDLQWTIITQARAYAKAMKATLFFSSATHNINVNKIFKFILAKLFNLPWTIKRNLTVGEPIIDF